ncbi:MAG: hypothetical protein HMLKMBBP_01897 [Planctomycetes bacterium]|nr:hypothetical protein [Planctomycetota bacterium]
MRYAIPLADLDAAWRTPAGAALIDAALDDQDRDDAVLVTVHGKDAVVLRGPGPRVAAMVAWFVTAARNAPDAPTVRVFGDDGDGWRRVTAAPAVGDLPDEQPAFEDDEAEAAEEALVHA